MKALIIGLDAAEYDLIALGNFSHLKQVEYGRVEINVRPLFTPMVWASFITGIVKEGHEIHGLHKWRSGFIERLRNWSLETGLSHRMIGKGLVRVGRFLEFLGFKTRPYERSDLGASTIFDYVDKHIAISVPSYNEDDVNIALKKKELDALRSGNRRVMKEAEELAWKIFREKRKRVLDLLKKDWDILMVHFYILDPLQHLFWYDDKRMNRAYEEMDGAMKLIQDGMPNDCLMLIVSDHGQKKGMHMPYGFYSSNVKLGLNDPKITDFAEIIRSHLGLPSREEEMRVYRRLKSLGYV